nr:DUF6286 domain-containing protein [Rhodococcus sp. HNM0569]
MPAAVAIAGAALVLAAVCARELLIVHDVVGGAPWVRNTVEWAARLHWSDWIIPVIVVSVVTGLVCVALAVKPRPRTHVPLRTPGAPGADGSRSAGAVPIVWARPTDLARGTSSRALAVPGVDAARTTVDRKRVTVHVRGSDEPAAHVDDDVLIEAVTDAVAPTLGLLEAQPDVRVRIKR